MNAHIDAALSVLSSTGIGQDEAVTLTADKSQYTFPLYILIGVLVLIIFGLIFVSVLLGNMVRIREGREPYTLKGTVARTQELALNPFVASVGTVVVLIVFLIFYVPEARSVGLAQGYQPEQPIKFSHQLHAGQYEIDCKYCHTGVTKGKNAWIPSVNVCMNCHKGIAEGPLYGKTEIAKLRNYYEKGIPIEWVRVHNLPDLAYFSHKQHVVVGNLECETCHGDIASMQVVEQVAPLSMGWCINCHRETQVDAELYHGVYGRTDVSTVEDIGGLDCARCHY